MASIEYTSIRSPKRGSLLSSRRNLARSELASGSENVVSRTRAWGWVQAMMRGTVQRNDCFARACRT